MGVVLQHQNDHAGADSAYAGQLLHHTRLGSLLLLQLLQSAGECLLRLRGLPESKACHSRERHRPWAAPEGLPVL